MRSLAERHLVILTAGTGAQVPAADSTLRRAADDVTRQVGTWRGFHVSATKAGQQPFTETTVSEVDADVEVGRGLGCRPGHRCCAEHAGKASSAGRQCSCPRATFGPHAREHEEQDMRQRWFSQTDLVDMIKDGIITDSATIAAYLFYLFADRHRISHRSGS